MDFVTRSQPMHETRTVAIRKRRLAAFTRTSAGRALCPLSESLMLASASWFASGRSRCKDNRLESSKLASLAFRLGSSARF